MVANRLAIIPGLFDAHSTCLELQQREKTFGTFFRTHPS